MAIFFVVSTPIGNLKDISPRALQALSEVDLILCEDTRVTKKLLNHYQIKTPTLSYHQHSELRKINYIISLLRQGKSLALVSDAGTPGISDPGNKLIEQVIKMWEGRPPTFLQVEIVPVPGPSAVTAAASVAGFPMDKFVFLGFPPAKKKRKKFFQEIINAKYPIIFYESPYRIIKSLEELGSEAEKNKAEFKIAVCRELTKKFETIYRGTIKEVIKEIKKDKIKGEFVVVVDNLTK